MRRIGAIVSLLAGGLAISAGASREQSGATEPASISFGGRAWKVKAGRALGPGPNDWSAARECVRGDDSGQIRLAITPAGGLVELR